MLRLEEGATVARKKSSKVVTDTPKTPVELADRLLTRLEAAAWLGVSKQYLAALAMKAEGPKFKVIGRKAMYHMDDVKTWWAAQSYAGASPEPGAEKVPKEKAPKKTPGRKVGLKVSTPVAPPAAVPDTAAMMELFQTMMKQMQQK